MADALNELVAEIKIELERGGIEDYTQDGNTIELEITTRRTL